MKRSFSSAETRAVLENAVRLAAIDGTDISTTARSAALLPIVRLAARVLGVPVAQINLLTAGAQVPVASSAPNDPDPDRWRVPVGLEASYCQYVVASGLALVVVDARKDELLRDNLATTEAGIVAYAGVPLHAPDSLGAELGGQVLGSVCVVDFTPRSWSAEDLALLNDLSAAVTAELGIRAETAARAASHVAAVATDALDRAGAALVESEARFRTMANSIPQLAWMADEHGAMDWFNDRFYEFAGKTFAELRDDAMASVHPEHRERVVARFREAVRSRQPWEDTFPLRHHDGTYRWFLSRAVPVCDPEEMVIRWFGTNTDVSEQIAAETERERLLRAEQVARRVAEEASRARTQFLAVMSHELRTPLNAIGGYAELLELGLRGPVTDAQRTDLARIRRSQQHLLGLINEILNFTKLESGTVSFDSDDVGVMEMLNDVVGMIHPQAAAKGLRLEVDAPDPRIAVRADREKLRQVLINLTTNAVKFTPAPGTVSVACVAEAALVRIVVRDTGMGIPHDKLDAVFEPFVQVRPDLARVVEGTGLGLSISRALARGLGGDLTVSSEMGAGSVFTVIMPRATDMAVAPGELPADHEPLETTERAARAILAADGVSGVLRYLNARTSHRFTGLYAFDGDILRSVALFDRTHPENAKGDDAPLHETYCSMVGALGRTVAIADASVDHRVAAHPARDTVVSYCGALVRGGDGVPLGTLCSFDIESRPVPSAEIPLLEAVAPLLAAAVTSYGAARRVTEQRQAPSQ